MPKNLFKTLIKTKGNLEAIRRHLLDLFFLISVCIGIFPITGSVIRAVQYGWKPQYIFHLLMYFIVLIIYRVRKRFTTRTIAILFSSLFAVNGIINMTTYGLASMGLYNFTFVIFMVIIFLGVREGILSALFFTVCACTMSYLICKEILPMNFDAQTYIISWTGWSSQLTNFIAISATVILFLYGITSSLFYSLDSLKKSRDEAIKSEEKMRTLLATAPDAIVTTDLNGIITSCNDAALKLLNFQTEEQLIGQSGLELIIPDDEARARSNMQKIKKGDTIRAEYVVNYGEKDMIPLKVSASAIYDKDKKPYGIIYIAQDVSESRELEEKLRQSEKMQAMGQLAGGIAHDFNNQLTSIVGYAELIREENSNNTELSHYAGNILLSTKRASDLTAQLLAFARKGKFLQVPVNLNYVITEVTTILNRTIDKRITIKQSFGTKSPVTTGDPTQIQNAIMNIALNSRNAMPEGGELTFTTVIIELDDDYCRGNSFEIHAGQYIQVSITDNGKGMSDITKKRIFEPFYTTKPQGKGTGMGLASVYGTMINHHGAINVYSELEYGTTVNLYFPLAAVRVEPEKSPVSGFHLNDSGAHILLVDDEELVLKTASIILQKSGYKVTKAANGREALELYRKSWKNIDLVILDMIMPELNGKETYVEMKKINPKILTLLSSGYSINDQAQNILDKGVQGFIKKPYRKTELLQKISELLEMNMKKEII